MAYDLPSLIRSIPNFSTKTAEECRAWFAESVTTLDHTPWTAGMFYDRFGSGPFNEFLKATSTAFPLINVMLNSGEGIDLGDDREEGFRVGLGRVKAALLATNQPAMTALAGLVDTVLALGQDTRTRWERAGGTDEIPSVDDIAAAKATILLQASWTNAVNEQFTPLAAAGNAAGLKAALLAFAETL